MKLLKRLKQTFTANQDANKDFFKRIEVLNKENRLHTRYPIALAGILQLRLSNGLVGNIRDLSYNGIGVQYSLKGHEQNNIANMISEATFDILDYSFPCTVKEVRRISDPSNHNLLIGYAIHHQDAKTLTALRDIIEPLRCGHSMVALDPLIRHDRYRTPDWHCFRGDGPCDLLLRRDKENGLAEALLTFRLNENYCELSYMNNTLKTGQMLSSRPSKLTAANQMASTVALDLALLRYSIFILLGTKLHFNDLVEPILRESLKYLKLEEKSRTA